MPAHHHLDSASHSPTMPPEVAQAFGRMSLFMKDISLITGDLANVMAFTPHESRSSSSSGKEDPPTNPSRSWIITQSFRNTLCGIQLAKGLPSHPAFAKTPSTPSKFAINHEGIESKASLPKSSPVPFTFGFHKPALAETPSSPSKLVINHEELHIESKVSNPEPAQSVTFTFEFQKPAHIETPSSSSKSVINPCPFTLATKKPIVPETPPAACKSGINHEELNIESKASLLKSSQSASSASAPNKTTTSKSTCPEDLIATLDGLKVPSTSPAFSAFLTRKSQSTFTTKNTKANEPKPTALTSKIQSQTPKPDLMVWTVYKDARYRITYQGQETKSIWLDMEFDGIRTCTTAYELESALVTMLEGLKKHAKMLPKSQRDGQPHLVSSDLSDKSHTAAIYYDGRVITSTARSMSKAIERVKEMKQGSVDFHASCGYIPRP
ncbi:hypothetical protein KEM48_011914 [Puccinia striiformis f. sp. tritici PST-130]|nr:hypothetical protein KEM48_011914 [Puccinia striiformis f. sp. tritici PST-130]